MDLETWLKSLSLAALIELVDDLDADDKEFLGDAHTA
jgi:hypothetical protein